MKYSNPRIPEGINTSKRHALTEFAVLAGGALLLIALVGWVLGSTGGYLARQLPFEYEASLVPESLLQSDASEPLQRYLDRLANRLIAEMEVPEDMDVRLSFSGEDTFNAFATLGGNVLLYRGLTEQLPHENALSMLIAHEIAHVVHRDPIVGIGRAAAIQLAVSLFLGDPNLSVLGSAGIYTQLHFSREMEGAADAAALAAVNAVYGHVAGAQDLFATIQVKREKTGTGEPAAIFSSHPLDRQRLEAITSLAEEHGWVTTGPTQPLPAEFTSWMEQAALKAGQNR